jgi:HSP20 family protein
MANETKSSQGNPQKSGQQTGAQNVGLQGTEQRGGQQGQGVPVRQGQQGGGMEERRQGGMARYSRNPFALMQEMSDEMDRLFDSFFYGAPMRGRGQRESMPSLWAPEVELSEEGNQLRVCVDLPGISKDNVKIDVQEGALVIQGERREERTEGGEQQGFRRSERRYGSFYRTIPLPDYADTEKAEATMKDGVLNITLPITQGKQARRLEIQG